MNELITNSLKYAFPGKREGRISISLTGKEPGKHILQYSDNGIGVPAGFDFKKHNTLGLKLIHSIVELQMMGKVNFSNMNGVTCLIELSTALYKERV